MLRSTVHQNDCCATLRLIALQAINAHAKRAIGSIADSRSVKLLQSHSPRRQAYPLDVFVPPIHVCIHHVLYYGTPYGPDTCKSKAEASGMMSSPCRTVVPNPLLPGSHRAIRQ